MSTTNRPRPRWIQVLREDLRTAAEKDPSITSTRHALMHQGVHGVWLHRLAQRLQLMRAPLAARWVAYANRVLTGIDVNPGAMIGRRVFIDHGAGVVIGETAVIEDDVMIYHNVTVGSVGWWRDGSTNERRHPYIQARTVLCTGALILGAIVVGRNCIIGANTVVLADVPDGTRVPAGTLWRTTPGSSVESTAATPPKEDKIP